MKLRFTRRAIENLTEIAAYLNERNPRAALRVRGAIAESLEYLTSFPQVDEIVVLSAKHPAQKREHDDA